MKKSLSLFRNALLYLVLFVPCSKLYSQSNVFGYGTFGGDSYRAEVVKSFNQGDSKPSIRFKHTKLASGESHYEDYIDYVTDAGIRYRAFILYNYDKEYFFFRHCKFDHLDQCHDDVIMNYKDGAGCKRQLTIDKSSLDKFLSNSEIIKVNSTLLGNCAKVDPVVVPPRQGDVNPRYSVDRLGTDWVVTFTTFSKIRVHTQPDHFPLIILDVYPNYVLQIKPGQWAESWFYRDGNYVWSLMSDVDHR